MSKPTYLPSFSLPCRICDTLPTVIVVDHIEPETELCGPHFFHDDDMRDWDLWDEQPAPEAA